MSDWDHESPSPRGPGLDDVKLVRDVVPNGVIDRTFRAAFRFVKERPKETLLFGFIQTITGTGGGWLNPSRLFPGSRTSPEPDTYYEQADSILGFISPVIGAVGLTEATITVIVVLLLLAALLAFYILQIGIDGGVMLFWLRLVRGQDAQLKHVRGVMPLMVPLVLTDILAMFAIFGGYLAVIIPGIMLMLGFQFVGLIVLDKNLRYLDALKASWRIADGHKWDLLILLVMIMLLNTAGALFFCVGLFVTTAITTGAVVIVYDRIAEPGNAYLEVDEDTLMAFD